MDLIDQANASAEQMLMAQRTIRKHSKLLPAGSCHYCDELLPKVGQLFCNKDCTEDYDREADLKRRAGHYDG